MVAVVAGALALLLVASTAAQRLGEQAGRPAPSPQLAPTEPVPSPGTVVRYPAPEDPLRVYVGGDSLAVAFATAFIPLSHQTGVVKTVADYHYASGLVRPDRFDWPRQLRQQLAVTPPYEALVMVLGGNDAYPIETPGGVLPFGTPAWRVEYERRAGGVMDQLLATGAEVFWVGLPVVRNPRLSARFDVLNDSYARLAARRPGVTFVDTRPLFSDHSGRYADRLPDPSGRPVLVRAADGVHLTPAGGERMAREMLRRLARYRPLDPSGQPASR